MLRRKLFLFIIAILCGVAIYLDTFYFFSPLNLKKSEVTQLTWKDTKYPMQIEYLTYDADTGWKINKISKNRDEIKYFIKSFEYIPFLKDSISEMRNLGVFPQVSRGKENLIILRHVDKLTSSSQTEGTIVFQFKFYQNEEYGTTNELNYFRMPQELRERILLENRKSQ